MSRGTELQPFFEDLMAFYRANRRRIDRGLNLKWPVKTPESRIFEFCSDHGGRLVYDNLCCLAFMFSNATGKGMPDHVHARMLLGAANDWVKMYVRYVDSLRPHFLWFNPNPNNFKRDTLGPNGWIRQLGVK